MKSYTPPSTLNAPLTFNVYEAADLASVQEFAKTIDFNALIKEHGHATVTGTAASGVHWYVKAFPSARHKVPKRISLLKWVSWVEPNKRIEKAVEDLFKSAGFSDVWYDCGRAS